MILVVKENARLKLALNIPTGAPVIVAQETIDTLPFVAGETTKSCQNNQRQQYI